jgi:hypothetical protein
MLILSFPQEAEEAQQEGSKRNTKGVPQSFISLGPVSRDSLLFSPAPLAALDVSILSFLCNLSVILFSITEVARRIMTSILSTVCCCLRRNQSSKLFFNVTILLFILKMKTLFKFDFFQ